MRWFEEHMRAEDDADSEPAITSFASVATLADRVMDAETMAQFIREAFVSQKAFGEFLGVGESTVAGWIKAASFPDYAKRATLAAYFAKKYRRELNEHDGEASDPKVLRDGDSYMVVRFTADDAGNELGEVLARDIPTEKTARVFASALDGWRILGEVERSLTPFLEWYEGDDRDTWLELLDRAQRTRARAFHPERLVEVKRAMEELHAMMPKVLEL